MLMPFAAFLARRFISFFDYFDAMPAAHRHAFFAMPLRYAAC